jgi:hypothetical protein
MGLGFKTFVAGSVLTAAEVNGYMMSQSVMEFASVAARDAAITAPVQGMRCYIDAIQTEYLRDAGGWVIMSEPVQTSTAANITGFTGGTPAFASTYQRSAGWIDLTASLLFGAAPTTLTTLVYAPPVAVVWDPQFAALNPVYLTSGAWFDGTNNQGSLFALSATHSNVSLSLTVPFTWAAGSAVYVGGRFRMASRYT